MTISIASRQIRRREQPLGVVVLRIAQHLIHRTGLHQNTVFQHRDVIAGLGGQTKIVGDEQQSSAAFGNQSRNQLDDVFLHRHIQRSGGLVTDQHIRVISQRHSD